MSTYSQHLERQIQVQNQQQLCFPCIDHIHMSTKYSTLHVSVLVFILAVASKVRNHIHLSKPKIDRERYNVHTVVTSVPCIISISLVEQLPPHISTIFTHAWWREFKLSVTLTDTNNTGSVRRYNIVVGN